MNEDEKRKELIESILYKFDLLMQIRAEKQKQPPVTSPYSEESP